LAPFPAMTTTLQRILARPAELRQHCEQALDDISPSHLFITLEIGLIISLAVGVSAKDEILLFLAGAFSVGLTWLWMEMVDDD
jgi:hypothetical protein